MEQQRTRIVEYAETVTVAASACYIGHRLLQIGVTQQSDPVLMYRSVQQAKAECDQFNLALRSKPIPDGLNQQAAAAVENLRKQCGAVPPLVTGLLNSYAEILNGASTTAQLAGVRDAVEVMDRQMDLCGDAGRAARQAVGLPPEAVAPARTK
jgi:hypothetical protein